MVRRHIAASGELLLEPHFDDDLKFRQHETDKVNGRATLRLVEITKPTRDLEATLLAAKAPGDDRRLVLQVAPRESARAAAAASRYRARRARRLAAASLSGIRSSEARPLSSSPNPHVSSFSLRNPHARSSPTCSTRRRSPTRRSASTRATRRRTRSSRPTRPRPAARRSVCSGALDGPGNAGGGGIRAPFPGTFGAHAPPLNARARARGARCRFRAGSRHTQCTPNGRSETDPRLDRAARAWHGCWCCCGGNVSELECADA